MRPRLSHDRQPTSACGCVAACMPVLAQADTVDVSNSALFSLLALQQMYCRKISLVERLMGSDT